MKAILTSALTLLLLVSAADAQSRIKDITAVQGVRSNHLVGYGLVVGLNGTGDSLRNAPFTQQSVQSMLDRMGVNIRGAQARTKNIAAVMVMAELPAFSNKGNRIDITVASMGDATSLSGGSLLMTPLAGADDVIYAVAQGQLAVSAVAAAGKSESVTRGTPTSARIPNGAFVERDAPGRLGPDTPLSLELRNPDFKTAMAIVDAINQFSTRRFKLKVAKSEDLKTVSLRVPPNVPHARLLAEIGDIRVEADIPARIVIDERTGTIIFGRDVQIAPVAIAYGDVTVRVSEAPRVSQPLIKGETVVVSDTAVSVEEKGGAINVLRGPSLQGVVTGLNRIGLKPSGIIAVIQAIKTSGALNAELVVQ
jgi:flagellar P-ring protein precursor FlgI